MATYTPRPATAGPQGDPDGNAQNLETLLGKILRIDPEGSAPGEYTVPPTTPSPTRQAARTAATRSGAMGCDTRGGSRSTG